MKRKLFCELSPTAYKISREKCILLRRIKNLFVFLRFADQKSKQPLPALIYSHKSLIRRKLGNTDIQLQENKAVNLSIAAPKVTDVLIKPGQIFSFWHLVGNCTEKKGYKEGLTVSSDRLSRDIGGGMCQFTNLIHWMVLHTDMEIIEHHHHERIDLFPDYNRQIPFGTGTSILYNYLDYRFCNNTDNTYQLKVYTDTEYLCGEIRAIKHQKYKYHIKAQNEFFSLEDDGVYRNSEVYRRKVDCRTGDTVENKLIKKNHAKVMYDTSGLDTVDMRKNN